MRQQAYPLSGSAGEARGTCAVSWPQLLELELGCIQPFCLHRVMGSLPLAVELHSLEENVFLELLVVW